MAATTSTSSTHASACCARSDSKQRPHVEYEITHLTQGGRAARAHTILATKDPTDRLLLRTPEVILAGLAQDESPQP